MGNFFILQVFTVVFALSIATTIFNKRILGFPQAIGVPIVSAIFDGSSIWLTDTLTSGGIFLFSFTYCSNWATTARDCIRPWKKWCAWPVMAVNGAHRGRLNCIWPWRFQPRWWWMTRSWPCGWYLGQRTWPRTSWRAASGPMQSHRW